MMTDEIYKEEYYSHIRKNLSTLIIPFNNLRKKRLLKTILLSLSFLFGGIISVLAICAFVVNNYYNPVVFAVILFLIYTCFLKSIAVLILADRAYQKDFFEVIFPLLLFPVAKFKNWPKNQNTDTVISSCLFKNFDTQDDSSCFFGYYRGINVLLSETRFTLPVRAVEKPSIFNGITIQIEFKESIKNHVLIVPKEEHVSSKFVKNSSDNEEFDKYLDIYSLSPVRSDFVDDELWKIIKKMSLAYSAKDFKLSYRNNTVFIAMSQRKAKPFGYLFRSLLNLNNYDEFIDKFCVVFDLIDFIEKKKV